MRPRKHIEIGREYGWLTVLGEAPKDKTGHIRYHVRCRCGKEYDVTTSILGTANPKCLECGHKYANRKPATDHTGEVLNGWKVCAFAGKTPRGVVLYDCECLRCGHHSIKTYGALSVSKSAWCQHCTPDYHFEIRDGIAVGRLASGDVFLIDADMVGAVSRHCWHIGKDGYAICEKADFPTMRLHWLVLGYETEPPHMVDHIDRNPLNCCRDNLRFVTLHQNNMNRSIGKNNTTGYVGVTYDRRNRKYKAKICFNSKTITLLLSDDPVLCAQAYNLASEFLFREFAGHHNDVPDAPAELRKRITQKLMPYLPHAIMATEPVEKEAVA